MRRKSIIVVAVSAILLLIGFLVYWEPDIKQSGLSSREESNPKATTSKKISDVNSSSSSQVIASSTDPTHDYNVNFWKNDSFAWSDKIVDPKTGTFITFKVVPTRTVNATADVLVNGEKIGQVGAEFTGQPNFSSDDNYFVFISGGRMSCCSLSTMLYVIDIKYKKVIDIMAPKRESEYKGSALSASPYINSYGWNDDGSLWVLFQFLGFDGDRYYRIPPLELWTYDLDLQKYTFIKNFPEPAS